MSAHKAFCMSTHKETYVCSKKHASFGHVGGALITGSAQAWARARSRSGGRGGAEERLERLLQRGGWSRRMSGPIHWPWGAAAEMAVAPGTERLRCARACRGCALGLHGRCRRDAPLARVCSARRDPLPGCSPLRRVRTSIWCPCSLLLFLLFSTWVKSSFGIPKSALKSPKPQVVEFRCVLD